MMTLTRQVVWIKRCQMALAVLTVAGAAAFYLFGYRPATRDIKSIDIQIARTESAIRTNEEAARDLDRIKTDVERLKDQITRSRHLPAHPDLPKFIRDMTQLSQVAGLQRFSWMREENKKQALCTELPIVLQFTGPFNAVATFLRQAEDMPRLTRTRHMTLKSANVRGGAAVVDVSVTMSVFFADDQ